MSDDDDDCNLVKEIKRWAVPRGIKQPSIRDLTVSVDWSTVSCKSSMDVRAYVEDSTKCLSTLAVDCSLLANFIASRDDLLTGLSSPIASYPFYRSCFDACVGIQEDMDQGVLKAFDVLKAATHYSPRTDLYDVYVLNRRPRDYLIKAEMMVAAKRHVEMLATTKVVDFLTFHVGQVLWAWHNHKGFNDDMGFLARRIQEHLVCDISFDDKLLKAIQRLLQKWEVTHHQLVYNGVFKVIDGLRPYTDALKECGASVMKEKKEKKEKPPAYLYKVGITHGRHIVFQMARYMGDLMLPIRHMRHDTARSVAKVQEVVRKSHYFEGITKFYNGYKTLYDSLNEADKRDFQCLNEWLKNPAESSGKLSAEQARAVDLLHKKVGERRRMLFEQASQPAGHTLVGKTFTLLPVCSASRSFITIDHDSLRVWARHHSKVSGTEFKPLDLRNWWSGYFDPYKVEVVQREGKKNRGKRFRSVKTKSKKKVHVRHLIRYRDIMLDHEAYEVALQDPAQPVPFFLSNIRTDGVQVKLLIRTLADHHPTARHVELLVKKGYSSIANTTDRKLDIFKETRGVYDESRVKPLTKAQLGLITKHPKDISVTITPVDPGGIKMVQHGKVSILEDPYMFASNADAHHYVRSSTYRVMNLSKNAAKFEEQRRLKNPMYKEAISCLSDECLNHDTATLASYIGVRDKFSKTLNEELMSSERTRLRWVRHRAQQRACRHVARQIAGRCLAAAEFKSQHRLEKKARSHGDQNDEIQKRLELREQLRQQLKRLRVNVVVFGKGTFGHGAAGPCPRKRLIKKLAETTIVILIDEYYTSKMCCGGCGYEAKQLKGSRVLRCQSGNPGEDVADSATSSSTSSCSFSKTSLYEADRDQAAVVNMFRIGCGLLKGTGRPPHLSRKTDEESMNVE